MGGQDRRESGGEKPPPRVGLASVRCDGQTYLFTVKQGHGIAFIGVELKDEQLAELKVEGLIENFGVLIRNEGTSSVAYAF